MRISISKKPRALASALLSRGTSAASRKVEGQKAVPLPTEPLPERG